MRHLAGLRRRHREPAQGGAVTAIASSGGATMLVKAELPVTGPGHEIGVVNSAVYASPISDGPRGRKWSVRNPPANCAK
jgi:hypothetical protein